MKGASEKKKKKKTFLRQITGAAIMARLRLIPEIPDYCSPAIIDWPS